MNFTPDMLEKVLNGTKTQTRRPDRGFEYFTEHLPDNTNRIYCVFSTRVKWQLGRVYAVAPGRGKKGVARMKLLGIRRERACDISEADAKAEGFSDREGFFAKWRSLYGEKADLTQPVWVLTFVLVSNPG